MSYDFAVEVDTGGPRRLHVEPAFSDTHPRLAADGMAGTALATAEGYTRIGNYTSNVSPMWTRCLTAALQAKQPTGYEGRVADVTLGGLAGKCCGDIAPLLVAAVEWGIDHLDELRELNPDNGWGNAEGAVTYLWDIQRMCEAHPNAYLYISS